MEKFVSMSKDGITKNIPENLVSEYMHLGWIKDETKRNKMVENRYEK